MALWFFINMSEAHGLLVMVLMLTLGWSLVPGSNCVYLLMYRNCGVQNAGTEASLPLVPDADGLILTWSCRQARVGYGYRVYLWVLDCGGVSDVVRCKPPTALSDGKGGGPSEPPADGIPLLFDTFLNN